MKQVNLAALLATTLLLLPLASGCKSMTVQKARQRSQQLQPNQSIDEVYKLLGQPRETFAGVYVWEYYWPGQGEQRLLRVEFEDLDGKWVVRSWRWQ